MASSTPIRRLWAAGLSSLPSSWCPSSFARYCSRLTGSLSRHHSAHPPRCSSLLIPSSHLPHCRHFSSSPASAASPVRVRYAPSPTGSVHLGGLRTALYNFLLARQHPDGAFIVRIEDTDQKRLVPGAVDQLLKVLSWAGIQHDEGPGQPGPHDPYVQSERLPRYREAALQLRGHAYPCFCSASRLAELRDSQARKGVNPHYDRLCATHPTTPTSISAALQLIREADASHTPYTIRLHIPPGTTIVKDVIRGSVRFDNSALDDGVLLKSDGYPTYHLAVVVDDHAMGITHVIRGEEWMTSAPKHVILYKMFGWQQPAFAHLPLLLKPDGSKLSKRHADASAEYYIDAGFLPEAVVNFVAFLGWNPGTTQEVFTMDELISAFSLPRIQKGGAVVNLAKMTWFNTQHLRRLIDNDLPRLVQQLKPALERAHPGVELDDGYVSSVFLTLRDHVQLLPQLVSHSHYFFTAPSLTTLTHSALSSHRLTPSAASHLLSAVLHSLPSPFDASTLTGTLKRLAEEEAMEMRTLYWLLRVALTMEEKGPSFAELMTTMGIERISQRLTAAKAAIDELQCQQTAAAHSSTQLETAASEGTEPLRSSPASHALPSS